MFSIDAVINERLPRLSGRHPLLRKTLRTFLRLLFHEREFQQFASRYPHVEGFDFVEHGLAWFDFSYRVRDREVERIPSSGRVVIVANHPIGTLDGLALLKLVGEVRRDVRVVANDVLYALEPLRSLLLPVDNLSGRTRKENIRAIRQWLDNDGAVIIFPAGEVSRLGPSGIRDGRWHTGFLRFAEAADAPILPVFVDGRNSVFFYALSVLARPLSTLWLIHEMFKQARQHIDIRIGHPVHPQQYQRLALKPEVRARLFRKHVYRLGKGKCQIGFEPEYEAVAHPENRQLLKQEIHACEPLGETADGKKMVLYRYHTNSVIMREIGRLRELTFRAVQEGTGKRRDIDQYDHYYDHIVLWDEQQLEIVGAYRMVQAARARAFRPAGDALYTQTLFDYTPAFEPYLQHGLELGRSFVQPAFWGKRSLDYLWYGIGAYLTRYPELRYLFGPVSISQAYSDASRDALVYFYTTFFAGEQQLVRPRMPYRPGEAEVLRQALDEEQDYAARFSLLKQYLASRGESVPTLFKQYTELCEPGGVMFAGFNVDQDFSDCVDGFIVVDIERIKPARRQRYMAKNSAAVD